MLEKRPEFKGREVMDIKVRQQESLDVKPRQQDLAAKVLYQCWQVYTITYHSLQRF